MRVLFSKLTHHGRQEYVGDGLERADVDAAITGLEPLDRAHQSVIPRQQLAPFAQHEPPQRCQLWWLRTAWAVEKYTADLSFERANLLAQGGLRIAQPRRRPTERALLRDGLQSGEVAKIT